MNREKNRSTQEDGLAQAKDRPAEEAFLDFEIELGPGSGRVYPVAVIRSVAGEAREVTELPFDDRTLENQLLTLQTALLRSGGKSRHLLFPEEQSVQDFGRMLFRTLFPGAIGTLYAVSQRESVLQGKGLRLKLRILAPEMAALPWEFLYDPSRAEYICLSRTTPVVRYLEVPQPPQPFPVTVPLRILGMIATPSNLPPLDVQREQQRMEQALAPLQQRGLVQLTWLAGQTWHEVLQAMREGPWHIFHFIGHGSFDPLTQEGLLAFADEQGQADLFAATQLARLLADHRSLRLVVLNACEGAKGRQQEIFSSTAAILVRHGIPAVLAMQYAITDAAALAFARAFYEALGDGMPIDAAVSEARKAVSFEVANTLEWGVPVLFMRCPDGVLFTVSPGPVSAQPSLPVHESSQLPSLPMPLSAAIVAAVSAGALSGHTQASKPALADAYHQLKALLSKKFGGESDLVHAVNEVEAKPDSAGRQATLQEEVAAAKADQDQEVLQAAQALLHLLQPPPEGGQHVQQATGSYIAQADRGSSASVTIGRLPESSRRGDRL